LTMNRFMPMLAASASPPPNKRQQPSPEKTKVCRLGSAALAPTPSPNAPPIAEPSWTVWNGIDSCGLCVTYCLSLYAVQTSSNPMLCGLHDLYSSP